MKTLQEALANKLGDIDEPVQTQPAPTPQPASKTSIITEQGWKPQSVRATLSGIPASTGIVIGPVYRYTRQALQIEDTAEDPIVASDRLQGALNKTQEELKALYQDIQARSGADKAAIFQAHSEMLEDTRLLQQTVALI